MSNHRKFDIGSVVRGYSPRDQRKMSYRENDKTPSSSDLAATHV